jgi:hypothetical protein
MPSAMDRKPGCHVTVPTNTLSADAKTDPIQENGKPKLAAKFGEIRIPLQASPSPTEMLGPPGACRSTVVCAEAGSDSKAEAHRDFATEPPHSLESLRRAKNCSAITTPRSPFASVQRLRCGPSSERSAGESRSEAVLGEPLRERLWR